MGDPDEAVARSRIAGTMMHILFATLATEAESDDAIDEDREADEDRDHADRRPATGTAPTAP